MKSYDYVIVGAGIVGLTIARELRQRERDASILIVEKEPEVGRHGSGRNSGVLHSGIYYPEGSLKARLCSNGSKMMAEYCDSHGLPIARLGKVILPVREGDDRQLDLLYHRAIANGARVELLDEKQLLEYEPSARTATGQALLSPDTAVVEPRVIVQHMVASLQRDGVEIRYQDEIVEVDTEQAEIRTKNGRYGYGWLFNSSGQYADKVGHLFGVGQNYTLLPFKGIYYRLSSESKVVCNSLIYPVPDLNVPFLGVHYTKKIDGSVYLGPTAVPALGREHYRGLEGISLTESMSILFRLGQQYALNRQGFRHFSHSEALRFFKSKFAEAARYLTPELRDEDLLVCDKVGIRAQLLDISKHELVMDFIVENGENSTHVLNAISPAFTSSMSFAKYIVDQKGV
ncbi:L-2-hydroxyglutarate oxidase [Mariprofundus erugo]|uniref:L-2-hydroxyglutarate oxidase n=1 Tax=Mariprofundus erugo TaxID=2528639 RepID=A0A5R9GWC2_9PROT|nr:L-2-hydroxyglutarate oxidase [Mariprofundus erugo]TLS69029.1 L-2-hydroxyglutarate oxidase [Mariprofundus erugo]